MITAKLLESIQYRNMITNFNTFESLSVAKKYQKEVEENGLDFYILKRLDPSRTYKYLPTICRYALAGVELDDINKYIKAFDILTSKNKIKNKDIYSYKDFDSIKFMIDSIDAKTKNDIIGDIKQERELIMDNDDFLIFIPLSHRASVKYGMGTKWCISMKNDSFMWYALTNSNILFYFVIVKNKNVYENVFNKYRNELEESSLGAQGDIRAIDNFEKFVVMIFGDKGYGKKRNIQVWTKSNHLLNTECNNEFFKNIGLSPELFKNDLKYLDISRDDLDD